MAALALNLGDVLDRFFPLILPELKNAFAETQSFETIINGLLVLRRLFKSSQGKTANFHQFVPDIEELLLFAVNHDNSKIVSDGLRASGNFLHTLKDASGAQIDQKYYNVAKPYYDAITLKLSKVDIDQEVKSISIIAASTLVCVCHNTL